jgi:hypothetical protein
MIVKEGREANAEAAMQYASYAIWWVPRPGTALARFGAEWTGWCADRGIVSATPALDAMARRRPGVPGSIGRFGLHATIKSPFRLMPGRSRWALEDALADLAERTEAIRLPPLELTVFDGHAVLALTRSDAAVARLLDAVAAVVRGFHLPPRYAAQGAQPGSRDWGACSMPALERFHLPLTDRLALGAAYELVAELEPSLAPLLSGPQLVADLALVGDPGGGRPWRLLQRHALAEEVPDPEARVPTGMAWSGPSLLEPLAGF